MTSAAVLDAVYGAQQPEVPAVMLRELRLTAGWSPRTTAPLAKLLPERHRALLQVSNGLDLLAGSYRLFGLGRASARDLAWWNEESTWKFSWNAHAARYLCFGESALGNQFAYEYADLRAGRRARVHELYAITLEQLVTFEDFPAFFDRGFLNGVADDPYHERIRAARERLGPLPLDEQLTYVPSPLLSGGELEDSSLVLMDAQAAMVINGDLFVQLAHRQSLAGLQRLEAYADDRGRQRVRAVFA
jgi:hypothetical protein